MKRFVAVLASVFALQTMQVEDGKAQGSVSVSFGVFYDGLSAHGEWIACGGGTYGWRPDGVSAGWRPYTVGRWVWTDDGWYWLSEEPWGWATFHYGRWHYDDYYGWIWIPGYDWAPAWVEWRYGGGSVGWAPLSPYAVFSVSWGIHYRTRWYTPVTWWNFVDCGYIASPSVHRYVYRNEQNARYIGNTRGGGSVRYDGGRIRSRGPEREYVEREGRTRIEQVGVREVGERRGERIRNEGGREHIEVYRPRIQERSDDAAVRPGRVREERGRTLDLDTRKIDGRSREMEREAAGDVNRSRDALDNSTRRAGRSRENNEKVRERERVYQPEQPKEERSVEPRRRSDEARSRESASQGRPETRERKREEVNQQPQREEHRSPNPEPRRVEERRRENPMPERKVEAPRSEMPRSSSSGRSESTRSEGGRSRGR